MVVLGVILSVIALGVLILNALYARNVSSYTELLRRGLVRVKVRYKSANGVKVLRGWSYRVDLDSIMTNPVKSASAFVKVYIKGKEVTSVAFSTVEKFEICGNNYFSIVFAKRTYL